MALAQRVMQELYSLNYDRAAELCNEMIRQSPSEPLGHAMLARTLWARRLSTEQLLNAGRYADPGRVPERARAAPVPAAEAGAFLAASDRAIQLARDRLVRNPEHQEALLTLGFALLNLGAYQYAVQGDIWRAYRSGEQAIDAYRRLLRLEPGAADAHMAIGMALYLADVLPWKVKWIAFLFGFARGREEGKHEIGIAALHGKLSADDARSMLVVLHMRDAQPDRAAAALRELHARHPRNYIVHLQLAALGVRLGQPMEARAAYREILAKAAGGRDGYERVERPHLYISMGVACRQAGHLEESAAFLRASLAHRARTWQDEVIAQLELGQTLDRLGRQEEAARCYRAVAARADVDGSRQLAGRMLGRGGKTN